MEILEKLPGITVERHLLLHGSYTSARQKRMTTPPAQKIGTQREPIRNRYLPTRNRGPPITEEVNRGKLIRLGENRHVKKAFSVSQYHQFAEKPEANLELAVLGKNLRQSSPIISISNEGVALQSNFSSLSANESQNPPSVLKSILKRPGSGVSSRSCTVLEVMSLDSGMCRLAASLAAHKHAKGNTSGNKASTTTHAKSSTTAKQNKKYHENLIIKHITDGTTSYSDKDAPNSSSEPPSTSSPTKSVTFKLDPEMQNREKERPSLSNRRGDARWGIVISPHQTRNKEKLRSTRRLDFSSSRKREIKTNSLKTFGPERESENHVEEKANGNSLSIALLRHHVLKGRPSMNEIHHLSESYRKFLVNRALEQTPQVSKENISLKNTPVTLKSYLAEAASGSQTDSNKRIKQPGLDKQYMSFSNPTYTARAATLLPNVHSQN